MRKIIFVGTFNRMAEIKKAKREELGWNNVMTLDSEKTLYHRVAWFQRGNASLLVVPYTLITGWLVFGNDITIEFDETFPEAMREQAQARVKRVLPSSSLEEFKAFADEVERARDPLVNDAPELTRLQSLLREPGLSTAGADKFIAMLQGSSIPSVSTPYGEVFGNAQAIKYVQELVDTDTKPHN